MSKTLLRKRLEAGESISEALQVRPRGKRYELDGVAKTISQWAAGSGVSKSLLRKRLEAGESLPEALQVRPRGKRYELDGVTKTIPQWAADSGVSEWTLRARLKAGDDLREALRSVSSSDGQVYELDGLAKTVKQWSADTGESQWAIRHRLAAGESIGQALTPSQGRTRRVTGDLTGQRFNLLTVQGPGVSTSKDRYWLCLCDCGGLANVRTNHLTSGYTKSCGHLRSDWAKELRDSRVTHSQSHTPLYSRWKTMITKDRTRPTPQVSERWLTFENFAADMGETFDPNLILVRLDRDLPYSAQNCRWSTRQAPWNAISPSGAS